MIIKKDDEFVMKLLYYFINEENYNPIILHGAKDEIWLEKITGEYKIIRIVSNHIHNEEQLNLDIIKAKRIIKDIKRKTFSFTMPTLTIFTDVNEGVELNCGESFKCLNIKNDKELKSNDRILKIFPEIVNKLNFEERGADLFKKLTDKINKKNINDNKKASKIFGPKKLYVTNVLIALNVLIYMFVITNGEYVNYFWLSKETPIYTLFTSMFMHYNIIHLFMNMWALYILGNQIERFFGYKKYLLIYILSGLLGSLLSVVLLPVNTVSIGASGAIFGLFGSFAYFGYHHRVYMGSVLKTQILPIIVINLIFSFMASSINAYAHIGGLIGGVLISALVAIEGKTTKDEQTNAAIIFMIITAFLIYMAYFN